MVVQKADIDYGPEFDALTPPAVDLVKRMLDPNPDTRITAKECMYGI